MKSTRLPWVMLLGLVLGLPDRAFALDVCRGARTVVDRVDGTSRLELSRYGLRLTVADGRGTMHLPVSLGGLTGAGVPAGTPMLLALENGTRVTFYTSEAVQPTGTAYATPYGATVYSSWDLSWPLSVEAAHAVAQSRPIALRYDIGERTLAPDYNRQDGTRIQRLFACAANQMSGAVAAAP